MDIQKPIEWVSNKTGFDIRYYIKNGFWVGVRQLVGFVTSLVFSVAFARLASSEVFGNYQFIASIVAAFAILSIPGLNSSIIQSTARGFDGSYKKSVRISFLWSLVGIPALLILGIFYYYYRDHSVGLALLISAVFFPFLYAPNTWDAFFQGKALFRLSTIYASIQSTINTIAMVAVLLVWRNNLIAVSVLYFLSLSVFNLLWYRRSLRYVANRREDSSTIPYGWFLTKIGILETITAQLDRIIVGVFLGPTELAVYSIGIFTARKFYELVKSFLTVASPKISRSNTASRHKYLKIFGVTVVLTIGLYFLFPVVIPLLFSGKYQASVRLSQLAILSLPFFVLNALYATHIYFYLKNRTVILINSIITPLLYTGLMIMFIVLWRLPGLAFFAGFHNFIRLVIYLILTRVVKQNKTEAGAEVR